MGKCYLWIVEAHRTPKGVRRIWQMYVGTAESLRARLSRRERHALRPAPLARPRPSCAPLRRRGSSFLWTSGSPVDIRAGCRPPSISSCRCWGGWRSPPGEDGGLVSLVRPSPPLEHPGSPLSQDPPPLPHRLTATGRTVVAGDAILTPATIHRIEEDVLQTLRQQGLSLDRLLMDTTNFFTYHPDGGLHRKGHS